MNLLPNRWVYCGVLALALHALVLFAWEPAPRALVLSESGGGHVEVEIVAGASQDQPAADPEPPATPEEIPESPPEKAEPVETPAEMPVPDSVEPVPMPPATRSPGEPAPNKPQAKSPTRNTSSSNTKKNSSPSTAQASAGAGGSGGRFLGTPAYLVRPYPVYPAASRATREEGLVVLRITVNASGRPVDVRILHSSGYPRLDRAAQEAGWRCRIGNATAGDQFDAPLRFGLQKSKRPRLGGG